MVPVEQLRSVFEVHCIVMRPLAAPDEAVPRENRDDLGRYPIDEPGLAVPVGRHGKLRTGVQIMAMRNREDLCLDAGEVIEAAEGVVAPIDPVSSPAG